jgi:hypothetical protein
VGVAVVEVARPEDVERGLLAAATTTTSASGDGEKSVEVAVVDEDHDDESTPPDAQVGRYTAEVEEDDDQMTMV